MEDKETKRKEKQAASKIQRKEVLKSAEAQSQSEINRGKEGTWLIRRKPRKPGYRRAGETINGLWEQLSLRGNQK